MKPGWRTSELTFGGLTGVAICELVSHPIASLGQGIAVGCACLALAWVAGCYGRARSDVKRTEAMVPPRAEMSGITFETKGRAYGAEAKRGT